MSVLSTIRKFTGLEVSQSTRLVEDLGLDSLDLVELVMEVESQHKVEISDEEVSRLVTVYDLERLVETKRSNGHG
jgi:acyl carrier protein